MTERRDWLNDMSLKHILFVVGWRVPGWMPNLLWGFYRFLRKAMCSLGFPGDWGLATVVQKWNALNLYLAALTAHIKVSCTQSQIKVCDVCSLRVLFLSLDVRFWIEFSKINGNTKAVTKKICGEMIQKYVNAKWRQIVVREYVF